MEVTLNQKTIMNALEKIDKLLADLNDIDKNLERIQKEAQADLAALDAIEKHIMPHIKPKEAK